MTCHEGPKVEYWCNSTLSLISALDGIGGQRHGFSRFTPQEIPGTYCVGGWVGPRVGLDGCGNYIRHRISNRRPSGL